MKDKNLIIALVVSAAVIFGWSIFFSPKKDKPEEPVETEEASTEVESDKPEAGEDSEIVAEGESEDVEEAVEEPVEEPEGEDVTETEAPADETEKTPTAETVVARVWTPLYEAELHNAGLAFFSPTNYPQDEDSLLFERFESREYLPLQVVGDVPDGAYWSVDNDAIEIGSGGKETMVWTLSDGDEVYSKTTLEFDGDTYEIGVEIEDDRSNDDDDDMVIAVGGYTKEEDDPKRDTGGISVQGQLDGKSERNQLKSKNNKEYSGVVDWVSLRSKYFIVALIPGEKAEFVGWETKREKNDWIDGYLTAQGDGGSVAFTAYVGPKNYDGLKALDIGLERTVDLGWSFIGMIGIIILRFLNWINGYIHNYGLSIIILTFIIKVITWPLSAASINSTRKMSEIQPLLKQVQEKYKDDPQRLNAETMEMYKKHKINPFSGCLPLLVQMPIFYALFTTLRNAIEMKGAYFFLWINDLSQPDALFNLPFTIPLIGADTFNVLPLIMIAAMLGQSLMGQGQTAVKSQQQKMMAFMPLIFGVLFYTMPSGLVLYWSVSTILTILQQFLMLNVFKKKEVTAK
ncbi:MAG: membrane protein insertase YidC [bacterium]|nr:membrane protein insertase YidC [bacterium]